MQLHKSVGTISGRPCAKKLKTTQPHTGYTLSTGNRKINTPSESATGKRLFLKEKSQIAQLCQSFFLTMSRLCQEQYNITISMLVNGASILMLQLCILMFIILQFQDCSHVFIILRLFAIAKEVVTRCYTSCARSLYSFLAP